MAYAFTELLRMGASPKLFLGLVLASCSLGSCSLFRSDINSTNPLISQQAQRVQDLRGQVETQKGVVASERAKQKSLDYQLKSAQQELKSRKQQVKIGY